jgi:hypothetical protein
MVSWLVWIQNSSRRLVLLQASRNTKLPDPDWGLWLARLVRECQILGVLDSFGRVSSRRRSCPIATWQWASFARAAACPGAFVRAGGWPRLPDPQVEKWMYA